MDSIEKRLREFQKLQILQQRSQWMNRLHPLGKLFLSVFSIFMVVSCGKYELTPLILMASYPLFCFIMGELSLIDGLYRMRLILPLVLFVGILNPFFDRQEITSIASFVITGGMLSMVTLMIKGIYAVLCAYILIATTSIEKICYALRCIHVPKIIVTVVLLIDRYFYIMGEEADRIVTAYKLRAPSQKGINYRAWGTLVGMWLLRSMDKAGVVYESMLLRGFKGEYEQEKEEVHPIDIIYPVIWTVIFIIIKVVT